MDDRMVTLTVTDEDGVILDRIKIPFAELKSAQDFNKSTTLAFVILSELQIGE
jgi:hypothetical protein